MTKTIEQLIAELRDEEIHTFDGFTVADVLEQLTARVRELEEEKKELQALLDFDNARLDQIEDELEDVEYLGPFVEGIKVLKTQLAAAQLNNKLLREALEAVIKVHGYESGIPVEAISTQASTEALDQYVAEKVKEIRGEVERLAEQCRDYAAQGETDQGIIKSDGKEIHYLRNQIATLTRQRDLAVEALKWLKLIFTDSEMSQERNPELWMPTVEEAIKESEVKE